MIEQVVNVCHPTVVQEAWDRGQELMVHGWVDSLQNGLIRNMEISVDSAAALTPVYEKALAMLG